MSFKIAGTISKLFIAVLVLWCESVHANESQVQHDDRHSNDGGETVRTARETQSHEPSVSWDPPFSEGLAETQSAFLITRRRLPKPPAHNPPGSCTTGSSCSLCCTSCYDTGYYDWYFPYPWVSTGWVCTACDVANKYVLVGNSCVFTPCDSTCQTCGGSTAPCGTCVAGRYLMKYSSTHWECYEPCSSLNEYYKHDPDWNCYTCHNTCSSCFYGNTPEHCAFCQAGMSKYPGTNYCRVPSVCPVGTFRGPNRTCDPCPTGSEQCASPGGIHIGRITSYSIEAGGLLTPCIAPCATCSSSPTDCMSCITGSLQGNRCFQKCNSGFYDPATGSCGAPVVNSLYSIDDTATSILDCASNRFARSGPSGTCSLSCQPWETLQAGVGCTSVDPHCIARDGANDCTKCKQHYYLTPAKACAICFKDCLDCIGPNSNECLNCHPAFTYHPGNKTCGTECGTTLFFSTIPNPGCYPCHGTCASCSTTGASKCTSCPANRILRDGYCILACAKGSFYNSITKTCQLCNPLCEECASLPDNCLSCKANIQLSAGGVCTPVVCHANCDTCHGPLDTDCITTITPTYYMDFTNVAISTFECSENYFPDPANNNVCTACSTECSSCHALGRDNCVTCAVGYFKYNGVCVNTASNTCLIHSGEAIVFGPTDTCEACTSTDCQVCDKPMKKCSTCKPGFSPDVSGDCIPCTANTRYCHQQTGFSLACDAGYEIINNTCVQTCRAGKYREGSALTCSNCHIDCQECYAYGPDRCLSCRRHDEKYPLNGGWGCRKGYYAGYYISSDPCTTPCNACSGSVTSCTSCLAGFYKSGSTCPECNPKCAACSDAGATTCTACFEGSTLVGNDCLPSCRDGEFKISPTSPCLICNSNCLTCDATNPNGSNCLSCFKGTYLAGNQCLPCHWSCETCTDGTDVCTSCKKELTLQGDNRCLVVCSPGLYLDRGMNVCKLCHKYCQTCDGPSSKNCLTCVNGNFQLRADGSCRRKCLTTQYYTHDGLNECRDCHYSCVTCSGPFENQCLSCPEKYFLVENLCTPCNHWCKTCNGPSSFHCTSCDVGHYLSNNFCKFDCGIGSGTSLVTNRCFVCHPWCQTCSGVSSSECLSCYPGYSMLPTENFCKIDCTIYQFWERDPYNRCLTCLAPCSQCSGPRHTDCLVCDSGYNLVNGLCVSDCGAGLALETWQEEREDGDGDTYYVTRSGCRACLGNCATCINYQRSRCLTCMPGFSLSSNNGITTCVLNCLPGYLWSTFYQQCRQCFTFCEVCTGIGELQCSKCFANQGVFLLPDGSCKTAAFCPSDRFYPDSTVGKCLPCYQRCFGCTGTGRYQCTACQPNHSLVKGTCIPNCPIGSYYSQDLDDCILCHPTCKSCVNPLPNRCTACYNTGLNKGWLNKDSTCTMPCKGSNYMALDQRCKTCDKSCFTCTGPSSADCTYCSGLNYMTPDQYCKTVCPLRYFKFPPLKVCKSCFERCETCLSDGKNDCITCLQPTEYFLTEDRACVHCLTEYDQDAKTCHFAQGIWILTPKTTNINNKASTTIRITFNYEKKFTKRLSSIDWSEVFSVDVEGITKENYEFKNAYREGEILIDFFFRVSSKTPVAVKVIPVDSKRLLLVNPSTMLHELLLKKDHALKLMIPTIAPDLALLESMESMKSKSEYYAGFFAQFTLVLSAVVIVGQSPLGAPLMKFFRIFKMLSRFKLINIFFGAYLEIFLNIAGMLFKFGGDDIKNPEIRVTPFTRGKLNKYLLTTINTDTLAIKYVIYYFTLIVRVYQAKIREYARMHHLSWLDQIIDNIADKSRVIILTIVGVDVLFYTMHSICHIDRSVPQTRDSGTSYWVGMITLVVIIYDVCALIKQNIDCRFRIIYQMMRKDALILRRFRADGQVHPIEKNKNKELTEEEMAERKKLEAEEEQRRAEFDNDEEKMKDRLKNAREGNMDSYAWMMNGYLVRRYDKEEEADANGGKEIKNKKEEEEVSKRIKKFWFDRKILQGNKPVINPSAELFFSENIKYKSLKTFPGKYYNALTLTKVLFFEPFYVTLQMVPTLQISLIFSVQFAFLLYILWGGLKHKMFVSKVNFIQLIINEVAISIFLFVGLYFQAVGGESAMSPKAFNDMQILAICSIGIAFLIGAFDIFYSITMQIVIFVKTKQLRTYKKSIAKENEEKELVKYKDKDGEIVVQANAAKDELKKLPRVELLIDDPYFQEIKEQQKQAEAPAKPLKVNGTKNILGAKATGLKNVRKMKNGLLAAGVNKVAKGNDFNSILVDLKNPEIEERKEKIFEQNDILHHHANSSQNPPKEDLQLTEAMISRQKNTRMTFIPRTEESAVLILGNQNSPIQIEDAQPIASKKD